MSVTAEIQSLSPSAIVVLYQLDTRNLSGGDLTGFHAGTNELREPVVWQGFTYMPLPIEAEGFDISGKGTLPRPKLRVANINGVFSAAVRENDDLIGCKVTRKRTFAKFLDAVNFPGGVNPDADPDQHLPDDVWFVDQKTSETRYVIEWELSSAFDFQGVRLPFREVIQNSCVWRYRGPECGYTGSAYDKNDQPCGTDKDECAKRLTSCQVRYPSGAVPFGGFPGAVRHG